jgi:hypothetical protein
VKLAALAVLSLCGAALSGPQDRGPERPAPHLNSPNGVVGLEFARDEANRLVYTDMRAGGGFIGRLTPRR